MRRLISGVFSLVLLTHCGAASTPPATSATSNGEPARSSSTAPAADTAADAAYDKLVERARAGDKTVDFKELRVAYVKSSHYRKNMGEDAERISALQKAMVDAANKRDAAAIVLACDAMLDKVFIDLDAHKLLKHAHEELGHRDQAELHRFIELGLLKSITVGRDGKSAAAAWPVVTVDEEYFVLRMLDAQLKKQSLVSNGGHSYDVMETVNVETNASVTYYFDVDIHLQVLSGVLEGPGAASR